MDTQAIRALFEELLDELNEDAPREAAEYRARLEAALAPQWRRWPEERPEDGARVWVWRECGGWGAFADIADYCASEGALFDVNTLGDMEREAQINDATHWMPLLEPEAPSEGPCSGKHSGGGTRP